ncbi:MAG: DUF4129 domain-containing protein [Candidatus Hydrogenedentota bacterium]
MPVPVPVPVLVIVIVTSPPMSPPNKDPKFDNEGMDFHALMGITAPEVPTFTAADLPKPEKPAREVTDFHVLKAELENEPAQYQFRSWTDLIIEALVPLHILVMVYIVVFFLLDVRYIFTEVHDVNLRGFAFFLILGIVGINRLVAKEGSEESMFYIAIFIGATALYTLATTSMYDVGSVARNFLDSPWIASFFNMLLVGFLWWMTNRLMHECCIDENATAGDVGILTGALRQVRAASAPANRPSLKMQAPRKEADLILMNDLEAYDPLDWRPPAENESAFEYVPPRDRLAGSHPGMSVFYFSVPVFIAFVVGLPILRQGGPPFEAAGRFYVAVYTVCALALLLLTSLGGLREYFRSRRIFFPTSIGFWWAGLGAIMIAFVMFGAAQLPMPALPKAAAIAEHEIDWWTRGSSFQLRFAAASTAKIVEESRAADIAGKVTLTVLALFVLYAALRTLGLLAAKIAKEPDMFPPFIIRFFRWLDRVLERVVRMPDMPERVRRRTVDKRIAKSARFQSPMHGEGSASEADMRRFVAVSYDALCALAYDMGVPRKIDQTPYEFIRAFPKELRPLQEEAFELTGLYVRSAYSDYTMDNSTLDRLRKFWIVYEKVKNRVVR